MRRLIAATLAVGVSACSGVAPTSTVSPPPATGPGAPASVVLVTGDGQSAAPGTVLPVRLSVQVNDASGLPVPGVSVHFAVDSGGGSLSAAAVTTGSDGIAAGVTWTLGTASGTNVIAVTVATLAPVRFHAHAFGLTARTLINHTAVGTGGATLTYSMAGDALAGLAITVPAAAYSTGTSWTVVADSSIAVPLPAEFSQVGPVLMVSNGQGYADSAISLTMPMSIPLADAVAPFYFDPTTGTLEPITLVGRNATSATLATRHFSRDLMAIPGSVPTSIRGASLRTFGSVYLVWLRLPAADLTGTFTTGFQPGQDNWEFDNRGDYITPKGICEGMSVTEIYYYYFVTQTGRPSLYHHFDQSLKNPFDNVQGIRFAGSVQGDYADFLHAGNDQVGALTALGEFTGIPATSLTASVIILTMRLLHQPVLMSLRGDVGGHAVVAFKVTATPGTTTVFFADPNFPTVSRGMVFQGTQLQPINLQLNATTGAETFTRAYALGVTAQVPLRKIDARWIEFLAKTAGTDRYPMDHTFQIYDSLVDDYQDFTATNAAIDTFRTTVKAFDLRLRCPACPVKLPGADPDDLQLITIYKDSGTTQVTQNGGDVLLTAGANDFTVVGIARPVSTGNAGFLDSRNFTVIYRALKIMPSDLTGRTDTAYTFTATNGGLAEADTKFTWSFGDKTTNANVTGDSAIKHTFADTGKFIVRAQMRDPNGVLLGRDSVVATISNQTSHSWRMTSATVVNSSLPGGGIGATKADTLALNAISGWIAKIQQDPGGSTLLAIQVLDQHCGAVEMQQAGSSAIGEGRPDLGTDVGFFAYSCVDPDKHYFGSFALGPLGAGNLTGEADLTAGFIHAVGAPSGSINSVMHGTTISGTINWQIALSNGTAVYTIQFTGEVIAQPGASGLRAQQSITALRKAGKP